MTENQIYHYAMNEHVNNDFTHAREPHVMYVADHEGASEVFGYNWHKEQELVLVVEGTLELHVEDTVTIVHEGEIGCVNTGRVHYATLYEENGVRSKNKVRVISFLFDLNHALTPSGTTDDEHMRDLSHGVLNFPPLIKKDIPYLQEIRSDLQKCATVYKKREGPYELKLKSLLFDLFYYFDQIPNFFLHLREWDNARSRERRDKIFAVFDFVEKNYTEPISVIDMSNHVNMGSDNFYKFFTSIAGISPVNYLIKVRLEKAKELLSETDSPVTEVCFQCGFANVSYFIRQFKKQYGVTPNKYRALLEKK